MKKAKLTLLGAGPGDPDLISIKGAKALSTADVVLYDALVHPDLLRYAPANAQKVYVGKRAGKCAYGQEEINKLIVDYALHFGHVVRLKGGDPFIFGRGHEELVCAKDAGIETEIIPGISSSISVPEMQEIPLTRRHVNESFWVITGTTKSGEFSRDLYLAAQSTATIVVLMGMNNLERITQIYKTHGRTDTPVAVIQNGTRENEKVGLGTITTIVDVVKNEGLGSPAIIVIGEVVKLHPSFVAELAVREASSFASDQAINKNPG